MTYGVGLRPWAKPTYELALSFCVSVVKFFLVI